MSIVENEINIVVIGETGCGKSTFINYLANYFHHGQLRKLYVAIQTPYLRANLNFKSHERCLLDKTKSKTADCSTYLFELQGQNFNIVDTPGLNDTDGHVQDAENIEKVLDYMKNMEQITAIVLILNGAIRRTTSNVKNALTILQDIFPDAILSNLMVVLTNCEEHTVHFDPKDFGLSERCSVFHMQNLVFSSDPRRWSHMARIELDKHFQRSMSTIDNIIKKLLLLEPVSTILFSDLQEEQNKIKQQLYRARGFLLDLQRLEDELESFEISASIQAENARKFENLLNERMIEQTRESEKPYMNTICPRCDFTCHTNCQVNEAIQSGSKKLDGCEAMNTLGQCQVCPGRCSAESHYRSRMVPEKARISVREITDGLRKKYDKAKKEEKAAHNRCETIEMSKKWLAIELQKQYQGIHETIRHLQQTSSKLNITELLYRFIQVLQKDSSTLKSQLGRRQSLNFIHSLQQICNQCENPYRQTQTRLAIDYKRSRSTDGASKNVTQNSQCAIPYQNVQQYHSSTKQIADSNSKSYKPLQMNMSGRNDDRCVDANDHEQENGPKTRSRLIAQDKRSLVLFDTETEDIAMLSFEKLLAFEKRTEKESNANRIVDELRCRCFGESLGYLTIMEQLTLCDFYGQYRSCPQNNLLTSIAELMKGMEEFMAHKFFEFRMVPPEKRLQLAAMKLVIKAQKCDFDKEHAFKK